MSLMIGGSYKGDQIDVTNVPLDTYHYVFGFTTYEYFTILIGSIAGFTVILEATNDDVNWVDVTNTLFGVANLTAGSFVADTYMSFKDLRITATATNPINKLTVEWMIKKGGGR